MLSLTAEIEIQELDAKDLVTADIYDEKGNIVGQKKLTEIRCSFWRVTCSLFARVIS
jgi:hypothetical protein